MIVQALNQCQKERGGYLTDEDLRGIARRLQVPLNQIEGLVSFFPHYRKTPLTKVEVHVCRDMSCHLRGSLKTIAQLEAWAKKNHHDEVHVSGVSCLGRCDRAPAALINENLYVLRSPADLQKIIESYRNGDQPLAPNTDEELAQAKARTWQIDVYNDDDLQPYNCSYKAVQEFVKHRDPDVVIKTLERAGLLGMGGAGGRTFLKWKDVYEAKCTNGEKYVVCNADESEPGTFKDRDLLLISPHLTIEGMILAGLVVGAQQGWVYIRHEYPEQADALRREIERAESLGALGDNIYGSGRRFKLEVFVSPGNYICGEQTALIEALEDKRAEPRIRPPELNTNGYKNQPTLLNNVETFAWVPAIMLRAQGQWYANSGRKTGKLVGESSDSMRGMRFFSISGDVARPGAYEVPTGIPLGELIDQFCGGMAAGKQLAAVALSGPSGGLLPAKIPITALKKDFVRKHIPEGVTEIDVRDIPLDINVSRAMDIMIGAGIVIYGTGCDLLAEGLSLSRFFRRESCGKCVPCRIGSEKITEIGEQIISGAVPTPQLPILQEQVTRLADVMKATSICGLGQVASQPMRSLFKYFPQLLTEACRTQSSKSPEDLIDG